MFDTVRELITRFTGPGFRDDDDRAAAIEELRRLESIGQQCLLQLLADMDPDTRCNAATAMIMTFGLSSQPFLLPLLTDPHHVVRWWVCGCLSDRGDAEAIPALVERLKQDRDAGVRCTAAYALERIASRGGHFPPYAIEALETSAANDHEHDELGYKPSTNAAAALATIRQ